MAETSPLLETSPLKNDDANEGERPAPSRGIRRMGYKVKFEELVAQPVRALQNTIGQVALLVSVAGPQACNFFFKAKQEEDGEADDAKCLTAYAKPELVVQGLCQGIAAVALPLASRIAIGWNRRKIEDVMNQNILQFLDEVEGSVLVLSAHLGTNFERRSMEKLRQQMADCVNHGNGTHGLDCELAVMSLLDEYADLLRSKRFTFQDLQYFYHVTNVFVMSDVFLELVIAMRDIVRDPMSQELGTFLADNDMGFYERQSLLDLVELFVEFVTTGCAGLEVLDTWCNKNLADRQGVTEDPNNIWQARIIMFIGYEQLQYGTIFVGKMLKFVSNKYRIFPVIEFDADGGTRCEIESVTRSLQLTDDLSMRQGFSKGFRSEVMIFDYGRGKLTIELLFTVKYSTFFQGFQISDTLPSRLLGMVKSMKSDRINRAW